MLVSILAIIIEDSGIRGVRGLNPVVAVWWMRESDLGELDRWSCKRMGLMRDKSKRRKESKCEEKLSQKNKIRGDTKPMPLTKKRRAGIAVIRFLLTFRTADSARGGSRSHHL